jgi:hypothetical protein
MFYRVFESGSGKWVKCVEDRIEYTSVESNSTIFGPVLLRDANAYFCDFSICKRTMKVVPVGTNNYPCDCETVSSFLKNLDMSEFIR